MFQYDVNSMYHNDVELFRVWRIYPHLAFTSELDTLRWDMRSGFKSYALEPHLTGLCIYDARCCIIYAEVSKRS